MTKVEEHQEAIRLRREGVSIVSIAVRIGVAKSSVFLWTKHIAVPEKFTKEYRARVREERKRKLEEAREARRRARESRKTCQTKRPRFRLARFLAGDGRWMIPAPPGYMGKKYIGGRYIYEHRYLMECKLGRQLVPGEIVHHINGDRLDNSLSNLSLESRARHTAIHHKPPEMMKLVCSLCGKEFSRLAQIVRSARKRGRRNFYCGYVCAGHNANKNRW